MKDLSDFLLNRRTIRKYSAENVNEATLNGLLSAGCRTSTTGNMQVYSIIITRDAAKKRELAPLHFNQKMVTEAPVVLTFCADFNRFNRWCQLRKADPGYDNFLSFMTAAIDALLVAQTLCIAAEAKGLGICYLGTTIYTADKIIGILDLPAGVVPVTTVTLGWPAEQPDQPDRLPLEAVVHNETYHDYSDEEINSFYRDKEERKDSAEFVRENNKETLAQVFTDVRYKKADNIHFSKVLLQVLHDQGFMKNK
ncbi:MAG: nitroreductase family protein [Bacteroidales bacterium]